MTISWHGVYPAVTTLFHGDQSLDVAATLRHVDRLLASGVHGLIMLGTVGENCSLEPPEKRELLAATVKHVAGRVPVVTGVAEYTTAMACRWAADAASLGADGLNVRRITDLTNLLGNRYALLCGVDDLVLESMFLGAVGWVSGLVNAFPEENRLLWELATAGRWDEAREVYRWYTPLLHLDTHPKLVQYIKLAMAERGFGAETVRAPRLPLVGEEREGVLGIIRRAMATRPAVQRSR